MPELISLSLPSRDASLASRQVVFCSYVLVFFFLFSFSTHINAQTKQGVENAFEEKSEVASTAVLQSTGALQEDHADDSKAFSNDQSSDQKNSVFSQSLVKDKLKANVTGEDTVSNTAANRKQLGVGAAEWIRMIGSLLFIVTLILGFAWAIKQLQSKTLPKGDDIQVLSSITLGSKERLLKIQVEDKRYLIAISPSGIQKIAELGDDNKQTIGQTET